MFKDLNENDKQSFSLAGTMVIVVWIVFLIVVYFGYKIYKNVTSEVQDYINEIEGGG